MRFLCALCIPDLSSGPVTANPFNVLRLHSNDTQKVIDTRYTFMLLFHVFVHTELRSANQNPRRSHSSALPYCPSLVFSYTYKLPPFSSQETAPLFSCAYELPFLQVLSFDIHASDGGCRGYPSFSSSIALRADLFVGPTQTVFQDETFSLIHKKEEGQTFLSVPGISVALVSAGG